MYIETGYEIEKISIDEYSKMPLCLPRTKLKKEKKEQRS